ncbi:unnamed protein product [Ixodes hexagonus]
MEGAPKTAVILVMLALLAPLVFCRNMTGPATLENATVSPVQQHQPSTVPATSVTPVAPTTGGSWFFWRRSVDGNGNAPSTDSPAAGLVANVSANITEIPVPESLATRSADPSTPEPTSTLAIEESSASAKPKAYVAGAVPTLTSASEESSASTSASAKPEAYAAESVPKHSDCSNGTAEPTSAASTDLSGTNPEKNVTSNATEPTTTFQSLDVRSATDVPASTASTPESTEVTRDGTCHCHDTAIPSASAQSVTVQQQAHVTHPPADVTSATTVAPTPTARRPIREPQNPPQTTTTTAPNYVV